MTFQPGFRSPGPIASRTFLATNTFIGNGPVTFVAAPLGVADASRLIVVVLTYIANAGQDATAVTVAGIAATRVVKAQQTPGATWIVEMWVAPVPAGTSGNIVVTCGTGQIMAASHYALYRVLNATPSATATDIATPFSQALAIPQGGVALGGFVQTNAGATHAWTNLSVRDTDANIGASTVCYSTASDALLVGATPTIVCLPSVFVTANMALAAWR